VEVDEPVRRDVAPLLFEYHPGILLAFVTGRLRIEP
jgi:hypothetical protein